MAHGFKINSRFFVFFLLFLTCSFFTIYIYQYKNSSYEIASLTRLYGYLGGLCLLLACYILVIKKKKVLLSNFLLFLLLFLILEITCFFLLEMPIAFKKEFVLPVLPQDHIAVNVGEVPCADSVYHSIKINKRDTVYDVEYTIDSYVKRQTPLYDSAKKKYALFFGCSITFGEGVSDTQTMPYYFQKNSRQYNAYNYGISGHGTNHMLARLQYLPLTTQVKEKDGVAFYLFFWDHIYRSIGSMNRYCGWLMNAPYYQLQNGSIVRNRMFKDGRYFTSKVYELIHQSNIINYFNLDFPLKINEQHINFTVQLIKQSKLEYQKQFKNDKFYCVLYPYYGPVPSDLNLFKTLLTRNGIKYIDLTQFKLQNKHTLGGDPHPNPLTNQILTKLIFEKYSQLNPN